ncbi:hypothetical protein DSECCO2_482980 [anaerobic digester metagenome]
MNRFILDDQTLFEEGFKLKEYFGRYLVEVKGLSQSTVNHYYDALNNISRRLKEKALIHNNIYEITDLEKLAEMKEILNSDPDFISLNKRGNQMYSAGLNNYYRFACGVDFLNLQHKITQFDIPMSPDKPIVIEQYIWKRSNILRNQVIEFAGHSCEINHEHESFIAESTSKPYMEGHHIMPMNHQDKFEVSLDVYANIMCLCPVCHRRIHHGLKRDREEMMNQIYDERINRFANSGIKVSKREFVSMIIDS